MDRYTALIVGEVEILPIHDAAGEFVPTDFIPQVPPEQWRGYVGGDPARSVGSRVLCFLVRSDDALVLVDCGVGEWGSWRLGNGALIDELESLDVDRDEVDFVLMTHLHYDHIGGAVRPGPDGPSANFPNARHLVARGDWEYFTSSTYLSRPTNPMQSAIKNVVLPLADLDLIDIVESDQPVTESISLLSTPGHTPGSTTICIRSGGDAALLIGDAAHHQAQLDHPDWSSIGDADPELAAASRRQIVAEAVRLGAHVAGAHFDRGAPVFAPMVTIEGAYRWAGKRDGDSHEPGPPNGI